MKYRLGEILLVRMEFHQTTGRKVRPAVVLLDSGDEDVVASPVTSQPRFSEFDLPIREWKREVVRSLGRLKLTAMSPVV